MLVMTVGSAISLLTIGLKESFPSAKTYAQRSNVPPTPYLIGDPNTAKTVPSAYTCTNDCQFTAADKQNFSDWKTQYQQWQKSSTRQPAAPS